MSRYVIEIEPEVRKWLASLSDHDYGRAEFYADLLADNAETLGEPYSRHLGGRSANFGFTYSASRCGSPTGSPQAGG
jgi:hypothetical protein